MSLYKAISAAANGTRTIVTGVEGSKIVPTSLWIVSSGNVDGYFQGGDDVALLGDVTNQLNFNTHTGFTPWNPNGLCVVPSGENFELVLGVGGAVAGCITYELVKA